MDQVQLHLVLGRPGETIICDVDEGGAPGRVRPVPGGRWTHAAWLDDAHLLLGRVDEQELVVARADAEPIELVARVELGARWTHLIGLGDGRLRWADAGAGVAAVVRIAPTGELVERGEPAKLEAAIVEEEEAGRRHHRAARAARERLGDDWEVIAVRAPELGEGPEAARFVERLVDDDRGVELELAFAADALVIAPSPFGTTIAMAGLRGDGAPGGPPALYVDLRIALAPHREVGELAFEVADVAEVRTGPLQPVQPPRLAGAEELEAAMRATRDPQVTPVPQPWVAADPRLYKHAIRRADAEPTVELIAHEAYGPYAIAVVRVRPVVPIAPDAVRVIGRVRVRCRTDKRPAPWPWEERQVPPGLDRPHLPPGLDRPHGAGGQVPRYQLGNRHGDVFREQLEALPQRVINGARAHAQAKLPLPWEPPGKGHAYLIITDDMTWDAQRIARDAPLAGIISAFRRLITWKRRRGLRARLVTVTEIVAGKHGNFTAGAVDLPEVIRRFVRWAHAAWGTRWLLLGGAPPIVPVRAVAGPHHAGHWTLTEEPGTRPLSDNRTRWASTYLQVNTSRGPGPGFGLPAGAVLMRADNLTVIPFDAAGTSSATTVGWWYATDATYATRSAAATQFIRVNGPEAAIRTSLYLVDARNRLPTDLYYAALQPDGNPVEWDPDGNRMFTQVVASRAGAPMTIDVSVGRAPVRTAAEADAFVDKVIAYEQLQQPDGTPLSTDWIGRGLLLADNWGGILGIGPAGAPPPPPAPQGIPENAFRPQAGFTLIHLGADLAAGYELYAYVTPTDARKIPFAFTGDRYFYFVRSEADPTLATGGGLFDLPVPTRWLAVFSNDPAELNPIAYVLNHKDADGSMVDQERVRTEVWKPWSRLQQPYARVYADARNLPAEAGLAPPTLLGGDAPVLAELVRTPHLVAMSGHGNPGYCCTIGPAHAPGLPAQWMAGVYYADSCLTNAFDVAPSFGAALVVQRAAGAVAYTGYTREGFIGEGDDLQRLFWGSLRTNRRLGAMNDTRTVSDTAPVGWARYWSRWQMFAQNLLGDPEMYVWPLSPGGLYVTYVLGGPWANPLLVLVRDHVGQSIDATVHVDVGGKELFVEHSHGSFNTGLKDLGAGVTVTVSKLGYRPVIDRVVPGHPRLRDSLP